MCHLLKRAALSSLALLFAGGLRAAAAAGESLPSPLGLPEAVAYALAHNPSLLVTKEQIREREGLLVEARARTIPKVEASANYTRMDDKLVSGPTGAALSDNRDWKTEVLVTQVLYAGGSVRAGVRAQKEQAEAARLAFAAAVNDTVLLVTQRFDDVLLAREVIGVREEAVRLAQAELERAMQRRGAGSASDFEVLRAEVSLANAKPPLIRARNDLRVSMDRLREVLGARELLTGEPSGMLELKGTLQAEAPSLDLAASLALARVQRPELVRQEKLVRAGEEGVNVAQGAYLPTVSAVGGYQWSKAAWSRRASDSLDGWTAGLQANWSLFDGRATAGKVLQAKAQARQLRHGADSVSLSVAVEVRQAHSALTEASELLAASEKVVEQALESLRLAEVRQSAGTAIQLDVLQAQTALTEARYNLAQAKHAHCVAVAGLTRAVGGSPRQP